MRLKLLMLIVPLTCSIFHAQRLSNSIQYDYNLLFTTTDYNDYTWMLNGSQTIQIKTDEMILGHGLTYSYQKEMWERISLGFRVGYLFSERYFNRLLVGGTANYYINETMFTLLEINYGIGLWSNGSTHNPGRSKSQLYISVGFGLFLKEYLSIQIKYSRPMNTEYGDYHSNMYYDSGKYYLNHMTSISTAWYF